MASLERLLCAKDSSTFAFNNVGGVVWQFQDQQIHLKKTATVLEVEFRDRYRGNHISLLPRSEANPSSRIKFSRSDLHGTSLP